MDKTVNIHQRNLDKYIEICEKLNIKINSYDKHTQISDKFVVCISTTKTKFNQLNSEFNKYIHS